MARRLYTPKEYAELMGVSPQHVCDLCRSGQIKATKLGSDKRQQWRIPFDEALLDAMAEQNCRAMTV